MNTKPEPTNKRRRFYGHGIPGVQLEEAGLRRPDANTSILFPFLSSIRLSLEHGVLATEEAVVLRR